ncbi:MAG: 16S rRNA (adenine(1518)-N(6)/adenine(1519)-N(6))-dimethyltransferase RsmA [Clostridiales bacterium]|nr:16S rRNA (adenine(1518)-N(6)/adenine(1519)-N(6))-dimethyltransferase RsmA [Clostridiales bacterium]
MAQKDNQTLAELTRQGFRFKKELGQYFLFSPMILERIVDLAGIAAGDTVIEAGAGAGTLTSALAARGAKVKAVELDRALSPYLHNRFQDEELVSIVTGDVLRMDLDALAGVPAYKVCANLPYHISSAFVTMLFRRLQGVESGAVLLQKEAADRVTAQPGQEQYGVLALSAAWYGEVRQAMSIEPDYFYPVPSVESALLVFKRKPRAFDVDEDVLWRMIRGVFNQRRKHLLNGLKSLQPLVPQRASGWAEILEEAGLDYRLRPESLSLEDFAVIVRLAGFGVT